MKAVFTAWMLFIWLGLAYMIAVGIIGLVAS